jgi:hypothetical protein
MHSEGLANGELRSQFSVILLAPGGKAQFEPRSTPLCLSLMQHSQCTYPFQPQNNYPLNFLPLLRTREHCNSNHCTLHGPQRFTLSPVCIYLLPYEHYLGSFRDLMFLYTLSHKQPPPPPPNSSWCKVLKSMYLDLAAVTSLWVENILYKNLLYLKGWNNVENPGHAVKSFWVTDFSGLWLSHSW